MFENGFVGVDGDEDWSGIGVDLITVVSHTECVE